MCEYFILIVFIICEHAFFLILDCLFFCTHIILLLLFILNINNSIHHDESQITIYTIEPAILWFYFICIPKLLIIKLIIIDDSILSYQNFKSEKEHIISITWLKCTHYLSTCFGSIFLKTLFFSINTWQYILFIIK